MSFGFEVFSSSKREGRQQSMCNLLCIPDGGDYKFIANYFDDKFDTKVRDLPQDVIRVEQDKANAGFPPISSQNAMCAPNEGKV